MGKRDGSNKPPTKDTKTSTPPKREGKQQGR